MEASMDRRRLTVAILAMGGQGGGVLSDWIRRLASDNGYVAQATSVPGVAQRTGATVYYVEMYPVAGGRGPVQALMPFPGDIDVVVASELMEIGRAMVRGFVTAERTTLIGSTHRVYTITEKSAMGDGRVDGTRILAAANERAKRFIAFDMEQATERAGSVISSVMFGALAGSGALPFDRAAFENAIRAGGKGVEASLKGFNAGFEAALNGAKTEIEPAKARRKPTTVAGELFARRIEADIPDPAQDLVIEGVARLMDYQDSAYADLYLQRLAQVRAIDTPAQGWTLTRETGRYLALWMSYEDAVRVADLKTRRSRFDRVHQEVRVKPGQISAITEYMHPRLREICDLLPARLGAGVLSRPWLVARLDPMFAKGRHVKTTSVGWFLALFALSAARMFRKGSLRYHEEQARIEAWLALVVATAKTDSAAALELVECQRLVKGYGDTFDRGLSSFNTILDVFKDVRDRPDAASIVAELRERALADDDGRELARAIAAIPMAGPLQASAS